MMGIGHGNYWHMLKMFLPNFENSSITASPWLLGWLGPEKFPNNRRKIPVLDYWDRSIARIYLVKNPSNQFAWKFLSIPYSKDHVNRGPDNQGLAVYWDYFYEKYMYILVRIWLFWSINDPDVVELGWQFRVAWTKEMVHTTIITKRIIFMVSIIITITYAKLSMIWCVRHQLKIYCCWLISCNNGLIIYSNHKIID